MIDFMSDGSSDKIRDALKELRKNGMLSAFAAVVRIRGGKRALNEIIDSKGEIPILDRGMIGMHLNETIRPSLQVR